MEQKSVKTRVKTSIACKNQCKNSLRYAQCYISSVDLGIDCGIAADSSTLGSCAVVIEDVRHAVPQSEQYVACRGRRGWGRRRRRRGLHPQPFLGGYSVDRVICPPPRRRRRRHRGHRWARRRVWVSARSLRPIRADGPIRAVTARCRRRWRRRRWWLRPTFLESLR